MKKSVSEGGNLWASSPGDYIRKTLRFKGLTQADFTNRCDLDHDEASMVFSEQGPISIDLAKKLSKELGGSDGFWVERYKCYFEEKRKADENIQELLDWAKKIPKQFVKSVVVDEIPKDREESAATLLRFFNVKSLDSWYEEFSPALATVSFKSHGELADASEKIISWIRYGQLVAENHVDVLPDFSKERLIESLDRIKKISRVWDPKKFIPEISNSLRDVGVVFVCTRAPKSTPVSGASFLSPAGYPVLMMSFRYLSDDQFWFSLFHELGHLVLHLEKGIFVEGGGVNSLEESEADEFASSVLFPKHLKDELLGLRSKDWRKILRLAKDNNLSPGILVGQLQRSGAVPYSHLNKLKKRYLVSDIEMLSPKVSI